MRERPILQRFPAGGAAVCACLLASSACAAAATADLKYADGSDAGKIEISEATAGVMIKVDLKGLTPGAHALHVHETGKCEGDFASAGGIYNPLGAKHGFLSDEGPMAGDLPNVVAGPDGTARAEMLSPFLTLSKEAEESILDSDGSALVVFAKPDDYLTDPDGGAEGRVACGVLEDK